MVEFKEWSKMLDEMISDMNGSEPGKRGRDASVKKPAPKTIDLVRLHRGLYVRVRVFEIMHEGVKLTQAAKIERSVEMDPRVGSVYMYAGMDYTTLPQITQTDMCHLVSKLLGRGEVNPSWQAPHDAETSAHATHQKDYPKRRALIEQYAEVTTWGDHDDLGCFVSVHQAIPGAPGVAVFRLQEKGMSDPHYIAMPSVCILNDIESEMLTALQAESEPEVAISKAVRVDAKKEAKLIAKMDRKKIRAAVLYVGKMTPQEKTHMAQHYGAMTNIPPSDTAKEAKALVDVVNPKRSTKTSSSNASAVTNADFAQAFADAAGSCTNESPTTSPPEAPAASSSSSSSSTRCAPPIGAYNKQDVEDAKNFLARAGVLTVDSTTNESSVDGNWMKRHEAKTGVKVDADQLVEEAILSNPGCFKTLDINNPEHSEEEMRKNGWITVAEGKDMLEGKAPLPKSPSEKPKGPTYLPIYDNDEDYEQICALGNRLATGNPAPLPQRAVNPVQTLVFSKPVRSMTPEELNPTQTPVLTNARFAEVLKAESGQLKPEKAGVKVHQVSYMGNAHSASKGRETINLTPADKLVETVAENIFSKILPTAAAETTPTATTDKRPTKVSVAQAEAVVNKSITGYWRVHTLPTGEVVKMLATSDRSLIWDHTSDFSIASYFESILEKDSQEELAEMLDDMDMKVDCRICMVGMQPDFKDRTITSMHEIAMYYAAKSCYELLHRCVKLEELPKQFRQAVILRAVKVGGKPGRFHGKNFHSARDYHQKTIPALLRDEWKLQSRQWAWEGTRPTAVSMSTAWAPPDMEQTRLTRRMPLKLGSSVKTHSVLQLLMGRAPTSPVVEVLNFNVMGTVHDVMVMGSDALEQYYIDDIVPGGEDSLNADRIRQARAMEDIICSVVAPNDAYWVMSWLLLEKPTMSIYDQDFSKAVSDWGFLMKKTIFNGWGGQSPFFYGRTTSECNEAFAHVGAIKFWHVDMLRMFCTSFSKQCIIVLCKYVIRDLKLTKTQLYNYWFMSLSGKFTNKCGANNCDELFAQLNAQKPQFANWLQVEFEKVKDSHNQEVARIGFAVAMNTAQLLTKEKDEKIAKEIQAEQRQVSNQEKKQREKAAKVERDAAVASNKEQGERDAIVEKQLELELDAESKHNSSLYHAKQTIDFFRNGTVVLTEELVKEAKKKVITSESQKWEHRLSGTRGTRRDLLSDGTKGHSKEFKDHCDALLKAFKSSVTTPGATSEAPTKAPENAPFLSNAHGKKPVSNGKKNASKKGGKPKPKPKSASASAGESSSAWSASSASSSPVAVAAMAPMAPPKFPFPALAPAPSRNDALSALASSSWVIEYPIHLCCPVSFEPMENAVSAVPCGHVFDETTLSMLLDTAKKEKKRFECPECRGKIEPMMVPNWSIREQVCDWKNAHKNAGK